MKKAAKPPSDIHQVKKKRTNQQPLFSLNDKPLFDATMNVLEPFYEYLPNHIKSFQIPTDAFVLTIVEAIQRKTNFLRDIVLQSELSGNFSTNEERINFIQKLKDYTQILIGHEIDVNPISVCNSQEPQKTLLFIQAIAEGVLNPKFSFSRAAFKYAYRLKMTPNEFKNYVNKFIEYLTEFSRTYQSIAPNLNLTHRCQVLFHTSKEPLFFKYYKKYQADAGFPLIIESFSKLRHYMTSDRNQFSQDFQKLVAFNVDRIFLTLLTYFSFLFSSSFNQESIKIEQKLFKMIFNTDNQEPFLTTIYPVYDYQDTILTYNEPYLNLQSSTGSGKTRCLPFFLAIKTIQEGCIRPFIIMTQPGMASAKDKYEDFQILFDDTVICVSDVNQMLQYYADFVKLSETNPSPSLRPIIGFFSPFNLLILLHKAQEANIDIIPITRFCLDEIHERHVATDVLVATLSKQMTIGSNFPLHVVMMSATPDPNIVKCFPSSKPCQIPNSQLFPVESRNIQVPSFNHINQAVVESTLDILKDMERKKFQPGHILIFTSGNKRMKEIQGLIERRYQECSGKNYSFCLIQNINALFEGTDLETFYHRLDEKIISETNRYKEQNPSSTKEILFIINIKFMSYASEIQKEIAKGIIPNHPNVIKIITATNAIESSITIDHLAAVVDSGIKHQAELNKELGYSTLYEVPITKISQIQRKGRVGRVRDGIAVQITMSENPILEKNIPEILTIDLCTSILTLRGIGFSLEQISNLPDKIPANEIRSALEELHTMKALTKSLKLTRLGKMLSYFSHVSPFLASAILQASGEDHLKLLIGYTIALMSGQNNLILDAYNKNLVQFYDEYSDVVTVLSAIYYLASYDCGSRKRGEIFEEYGFNSNDLIRIIMEIQQTAERLLHFNEISPLKKIKALGSKENNNQNSPDKKENSPDKKDNQNSTNKKEISENKLLFSMIFKYIGQLRLAEEEKENLHTFITQIFTNIEKSRPDWVKIRTASFSTIQYGSGYPTLYYNCHSSCEQLTFDDELVPTIVINSRPGSTSFEAPALGYFLSINHDNNNLKNIGSYFHSSPSVEQELIKILNIKSTKVFKPVSIRASAAFDSDFSLPLLEIYFSDNPNIKLFYSWEDDKKPDLHFLKKLYYKSDDEKFCSITFITNILSQEAKQEVSQATERILPLLPYTPSTIIFQNNYLKSFIGIRGLGTNDRISNSFVFKYKDPTLFAYGINRQIIDYLSTHVSQMYSLTDWTTFAITCKEFAFDFGQKNEYLNHELMKIKILHTTGQYSPVVFSEIRFPKFFVVSTKDLRQKVPELKKMKWIDERIPDIFLDDDFSSLSFKNDKKLIPIPTEIVNPLLLKVPSVIDAMTNWFKTNGFENSVEFNGFSWNALPKFHQRILERIKSNPPIIPYKTIPIASTIPIDRLSYNVHIYNRRSQIISKLYVLKSTRTMLVPIEMAQEEIDKLFDRVKHEGLIIKFSDEKEGIPSLLCDYEYCGDQSRSRINIPIFLENGHIYLRSFCVNCLNEHLNHILGSMYDQNTNCVVIEEVAKNQNVNLTLPLPDSKQTQSSNALYPIIPFGQMIYSFLNEPLIANQVRTFMTALQFLAIKNSFTACPNHPLLFIEKKTKEKS